MKMPTSLIFLLFFSISNIKNRHWYFMITKREKKVNENKIWKKKFKTLTNMFLFISVSSLHWSQLEIPRLSPIGPPLTFAWIAKLRYLNGFHKKTHQNLKHWLFQYLSNHLSQILFSWNTKNSPETEKKNNNNNNHDFAENLENHMLSASLFAKD